MSDPKIKFQLQFEYGLSIFRENPLDGFRWLRRGWEGLRAAGDPSADEKYATLLLAGEFVIAMIYPGDDDPTKWQMEPSVILTMGSTYLLTDQHWKAQPILAEAARRFAVRQELGVDGRVPLAGNALSTWLLSVAYHAVGDERQAGISHEQALTLARLHGDIVLPDLGALATLTPLMLARRAQAKIVDRVSDLWRKREWRTVFVFPAEDIASLIAPVGLSAGDWQDLALDFVDECPPPVVQALMSSMRKDNPQHPLYLAIRSHLLATVERVRATFEHEWNWERYEENCNVILSMLTVIGETEGAIEAARMAQDICEKRKKKSGVDFYGKIIARYAEEHHRMPWIKVGSPEYEQCQGGWGDIGSVDAAKLYNLGGRLAHKSAPVSLQRAALLLQTSVKIYDLCHRTKDAAYTRTYWASVLLKLGRYDGLADILQWAEDRLSPGVDYDMYQWVLNMKKDLSAKMAILQENPS